MVDAMRSKIRDALKMLNMEKVGQNGVSTSSGSSRLVVVLHCLKTPGQVLVMLHFLIALKAIIIDLSNTWWMKTVWNANLSWIGTCWNLLRTLIWKILTF